MSEPPAKSVLTAKKKLPPKNTVNKLVQAVVPNKVYKLNTSRATRGKKIILYGASGMGKTTAACLAPDPVFVAVDDGVDVVMHPVTGEQLPNYTVRTYADVRGVLSDPAHFKGFKTIVLDNMTEVENLAVPHIVENVPTNKGERVRNLEGYGWGSGYGLLAEFDGYVKYDLQRLADAGFNIIVICQMAPRKETSAEVEEYLKDGPKLVWRPTSKAYAVTDFVEWSDYCFKIGLNNLSVQKKRASSSGERVISIHPETSFEAKGRDIPMQFPRVSFTDPTDDSIWRFVFEQAWRELIPETDEEKKDE